VDELKEMRRCWKLGDELLDGCLWISQCGIE